MEGSRSTTTRPTHAHDVLIELAHWLSRVMQYSPDHPSCAQLAEKMHARLTGALETEAVLAFGILKDNVMVGDVPALHPAVRTRIAPHLHDRGVLVLRFLHGVTIAELREFMALLLLPVQAVFDHGGLVKLVADRGLSRIQVEELAHDITTEQLESARRRKRLNEFFADALRNLLARRDVDASIGEQLSELLDHPEVTLTILEDQGAGLAEAAAGMALMVQQEEERTGLPLAAKLRGILGALAPTARDRLLIGFPPLVGEFRTALAWAMRGYNEDELARFTFPSLRTRANELDVPLYALSVLIPHTGTRLSTLRRAGLLLHDLPLDDVIADDVLGAIARPIEDFESHRRERLCLLEPAQRALAARTTVATLTAALDPATQPALPALDDRAVISELIRVAAGTKQFDRLCRRCPDVSAAYAADGALGAVLGMVRALAGVQQPEWRELAVGTARSVAGVHAAALLAELERTTATSTNAEFDGVIESVRLLVACAPHAGADHLAICHSAKLRKVLLDLLPAAGPTVLPRVRALLTAEAAPSIVHVLALLPHIDGKAEDLGEIARHRDEKVRLEVARLLRTVGVDARAMDIIVRYLADPSEEVRHVVRPLVRGELLGVAAIGGIERLLADPAQPESLHRDLLTALGRSRHDAAALALFNFLQPHGLIESSTAAELRDLAAARLHRSPAASAQRHFQEGLASTVRRVRKACERAAKDGQ